MVTLCAPRPSCTPFSPGSRICAWRPSRAYAQVPLVGEFTLQLSSIRVTQFNASSQEARLTIMDERFELWVTQVEVQILFSWHWEKLGMQVRC